MLALYRSGRQAEALEAYRETRHVLVEELGIEPSRELRRVESAILVQDPALDVGARARTGAVFVGREREMALLDEALEDALASHGRVVLVAGEPGIGKSRLIDELAGRAQARGAFVLVGRSWEAGGAPAYWPWVQALRAYARETDREALGAQLGAGRAELAQLLPELGTLFPGLPEPSAQQSEGARFRLFDAASSFLRCASRARPLVLVLDDLHVADEPSLLMLRFVVREIADSRLLVVGAFRDVDPTLHDPLTSTLAELVREPPTVQIALAGLSATDIAEYVERATEAVPALGLVPAIHAETEGNPLFVVEVVRLLDGEGRISDADARLHIPPGVRAVIGARLRRLSEPCRDVLVRAAVLGREFGLDVLAQLAGLSRRALLDALDEAMTERVVADVPGSIGRLRFGHALIRDTLYDELTSARKLQLHQRAGEAIEAVHSASLDLHLAELARQFFVAAPLGLTPKAIDYARRAGERAASQLAYEEAVRLYEMALELADQPTTRCELLLAVGEAHARAGDTPAAKEAFREAAELAEGRGLGEHLARAALGYGGRLIWESSRDDAELMPLLERALTAIGDEASPLRVRLLARLAGGPLRDASVPPQHKRTLSTQALDLARRLDDPATLAYALQGYIDGHHAPTFTPRQLELADELIRVATAAGDKERLVEGGEDRFDALFELGDVEGARAQLRAMAKVAGELRQPSQNWYVAVYEALLALFEGRLADAEHLIADARAMGASALSWSAAVSSRLQLYALRREQGRLSEVEDLVRRSVDEYPTYPIWRCVLAQTEVELGHTEEARDTLAALAVNEFASLPFDEEWLVSTGLLAETATALDDAERASVLYGLLLPYEDRIAIGYLEISTGSVARPLGLLAATLERWADAERHFQLARETNRRTGARPWLARTERDYTRMRRAHDTVA